jgi:hypothetical protein
MFIFKRPKVVIDCFTDLPHVYKYNKIDYANNFYPEWWKNTPKEVKHKFWTISTVKKCRGLIDSYGQGYMLPLWTDIAFNIDNKSCEWQCADYKTEIITHNSKTWDTFADPNDYIQLKLMSPWHCTSNKYIKHQLIKPFWNHPLNSPYIISEGVLDFKYTYAANINLFIDMTRNQSFTIKAGTPMIQFIPLTEKEVVLKHHLLSADEFNKKFVKVFTFNDWYKIYKNKIDSEAKCPFNFLRKEK